MMSASSPRLPGLRFTTLAARLDEVLPRMDVAVFIGFAACGPVNAPVVVEDVSQFESVFGSDAELAWDDERREPVRTYLAPTVRAFFRNGGVRCWVIRAAGQAALRNVFPVSGLINLNGSDARPACVLARSVGSWSDDITVAGGLLIRPIAFRSVDLAPLTFQVDQALTPGELIRMEFPTAALTLLVTVAASEPRRDGSFNIFGTRGVWLSSRAPSGLSARNAIARVVGPDAKSDSAPVRVLNPIATWVTGLDLALDTAPVAGALVRIDVAPHRLLLVAEDIAPLPNGGMHVSGTAAWWLLSSPSPLPTWGASDLAEVLTLELLSREHTADPRRLGDLGFQPEHPRAWWSLPNDEDLYAGSGGQSGPSADPVWQSASSPRFPLAGPGRASAAPGTTTIPLGVPFGATRFTGAATASGLPLERDGLATFDAAAFVDSGAIDAASDLDEATLVGIPDAVHRSWQPRAVGAPVPAQPSPPADAPAWGTFLPTDTRVLPAPVLQSGQPDTSGSFALSWLSTVQTGATFVLEEARAAGFADASMLHTGPETRRSVIGRSPGTYYYRVRVRAGINTSDWSNGLAVQVAPPSSFVVSPSSTYDGTDLIAVQRALVNMCAARGDMLAILALPSHYEADDAREHVQRLRRAIGNERTLSFGAVYHSWTLARSEASATSPLFRTPPDGAVAGLMADHAIRRGAWVAPANTPLQGVLAVEPTLHSTLLLDSGVNGVLRRARGFLPSDAETLSTDPDLRQINVRRLLILLRRLALRHGTAYVFEPHGDALRRRVQHEFEALLDLLLARGAFAATESRFAYQVRVDMAQNPTDLGNSGQLVVDLAVAPSLPMRFLTVRLVQSGGSMFAVEVA